MEQWSCINFLSKCLLIVSASMAIAKDAPKAIPGEYVVKFKIRDNAPGIKGFFAPQGKKIDKILSQQNAIGLIKIKEGEISSLSEDPNVEYIEPNYVYEKFDMPNDPMADQLWGMKKINMPDVWAVMPETPVRVAIIDTGVDYMHEDLSPNVLHGFNAITGEEDGMDDNGHGTHVAGTIGAVGNNGIGVAGVAFKVEILPAKFLDNMGSGSLSDAIAAIDYAMKKGARVLSNSWGGGGYSKALEETIASACEQGITFVAAAGNGGMDGKGDNNDSSPSYPASYKLPCVISVAATDENDELTSFSNYGKSVHVGAPGIRILSTIPHDQYAAYAGTSMATPHVSGVVALMLAKNPEATPEEIKKVLQDTSVQIEGLKTSWWRRLFGIAQEMGGGRIDALKAIDEI